MTIITKITDVFSAIGDWITTAVGDIMPLFYANDDLTLLGVLAVCGLAVSIFFLLMGVIQRFLHFGG